MFHWKVIRKVVIVAERLEKLLSFATKKYQNCYSKLLSALYLLQLPKHAFLFT